MATIENSLAVRQIIENGGYDVDNPAAKIVIIYQYVHRLTKQYLYAVFFDHQHDDMDASSIVEEPVCLWSDEFGITEAGQRWLDGDRPEELRIP